jgi:hypothetical protein
VIEAELVEPDGPLPVAFIAEGLSGVNVARNWLPPDFCPGASLSLISCETPFLDGLRDPSSAVANCFPKDFAELLELDGMDARLSSARADSTLLLKENML